MELPDPKSQKFRNVIVFAVLIMIAGGAYWLFAPKIVTGTAALSAMQDQQRAIAGRLAALKPGARVSEVNAILGQPFDNQDVLVRWKGPVAPDQTRIIARFPGGKLSKLTYMARDLAWSWTIESDGKEMVVVKDAQ